MRAIALAPLYLIPALWLMWIGWWIVAARDVKPARWKEGWRAALANRLPVLIGAALLAVPAWMPAPLTQRLFAPGPVAPWCGTGLVAAGLAFAIWAREHLGRNWSAEVSVKHDHALIRSGPYHWVRHPIYSGMTLAVFGSAVAAGELRGLLGALLILVGFILKLRAEEARMSDTFPEYADYSHHTARLIPGVY